MRLESTARGVGGGVGRGVGLHFEGFAAFMRTMWFTWQSIRSLSTVVTQGRSPRSQFIMRGVVAVTHSNAAIIGW